MIQIQYIKTVLKQVGYKKNSSDYVRYSDWASDIYRISDTKLISQLEDEPELE